MDTLTSSVSTIKLVTAAAPPRYPASSSSSSYTSRESIHHRLTSRRPSTSSLQQPISSGPSLALCRPTREARRCSSSSDVHHAATVTPTSLHPPPILHVQHHRRAASGYAVALVDVAQTDGSLHLLHRDVGRLLRLLQSVQLQEVLQEPMLSVRDKGAILLEVMRASGKSKKFHRHLMALLKMFVGKEKLHLMGETLTEFGRIYAALSYS
ncbi:hypothetical protein SAY87_000814 [Trapa incisa]|uniref:Uncharacterized protein n=2 Tax=Trapa TaxID=22665 RepID=A0AAN7RF79_TRANT|nr:hypothetical protein SAY87_000814 [Trapa incisa]KAK4800330.1 hypothetical protein SAY86_020817 [Trapa natans]